MSDAQNPYVRDCGCLHRGRGYKWERCVTHAREDRVEKMLEDAFGIPQCPEGCGDARRQKCMWEASDCPRHDVLARWNPLLKAAVAYVTLTEDGE